MLQGKRRRLALLQQPLLVWLLLLGEFSVRAFVATTAGSAAPWSKYDAGPWRQAEGCSRRAGTTTADRAAPRCCCGHCCRVGAKRLEMRRGSDTGGEVGTGRGEEGLCRREILQRLLLGGPGAAAAVIAIEVATGGAAASNAAFPFSGSKGSAQEALSDVGKSTKSGLVYFEYREGQGETPKWGQACSIKYKTYAQTEPNGPLTEIDKSDNNKEAFLLKHGNGRQIKGLEEGLHTMKMGGKRRLIIPPSLTYVVSGLGPFPASAGNRKKLNKALDAFDEQRSAGTKQGALVVDVELLDFWDDDADQGYYEDEGLDIEEVKEFVTRTDQFSGAKTRLEALPGTNPADPQLDEGGIPQSRQRD